MFTCASTLGQSFSLLRTLPLSLECESLPRIDFRPAAEPGRDPVDGNIRMDRFVLSPGIMARRISECCCSVEVVPRVFVLSSVPSLRIEEVRSAEA